MGDKEGVPSGPRCIALVGPFQSGKTTLLEAILARTNAVQRQGTVEAGTTVGDASKEARDHKMSVELAVASTSFMGDSYTFIDCPGSVEFVHDMRAVLPAVTPLSSCARRTSARCPSSSSSCASWKT
jgi:elongation factor G